MSAPPSARQAVLGRVRAALGVTGAEPDRRAAVEARLASHPASLVPARARQPRPDLLKLFADMLLGQGAEVTRLAAAADIPATVAAYLRDKNLPATIRLGDDAVLAGLPWDRAPAVDLRRGRADGDDTASLSRAAVAAAETGTLFLVSGPDNPTTLNFLPDTHIAVIRATDVLGSYEEAWDRLRALHGPGAPPRAVNLVSGPSRTADIEQTIIMGAHGPRRLHVILVDD